MVTWLTGLTCLYCGKTIRLLPREGRQRRFAPGTTAIFTSRKTPIRTASGWFNRALNSVVRCVISKNWRSTLSRCSAGYSQTREWKVSSTANKTSGVTFSPSASSGGSFSQFSSLTGSNSTFSTFFTSVAGLSFRPSAPQSGF